MINIEKNEPYRPDAMAESSTTEKHISEDEYKEPSGEPYKPEDEKDMDIDENEVNDSDWARHKEELKNELDS